ncbi:MAG: undecaprenyldiphospho-muramoylpentapeptide beta-N-acetylglucosaminyltransferase [Firmicutes bacterium]|nr:undecaprenyldiphospho-muramoylpentapeptide beta-N-acetylglucosaminyltransferase [Bacillota bacterium]
MRIVLAGGGTGGHLYPALAVARGIKERFPEAEILFVGTNRGLESQVVPKEGFRFSAITAQGLERRLSWRTVSTLAKTLRGFWESRGILKRFRPDLVFGTGGYVCAPVLYQAHRLGIPVIIHEQNAYPGVTNRWLSRYADMVLVTFEESRRRFPRARRIKTTGLPVRPVIFTAEREKAAGELGLDPKQLTLLSVGGSQGARSLNQAMLKVIERFNRCPGVQVIQVTGPAGFEDTVAALSERGLNPGEKGNIKIIPYAHDMENALAAADLIVCRAGASTLAEITVRGIPSILVPYPFASENHQEYNARALERAGAAEVLLDRDLNGEVLLKAVESILLDQARREKMAAAALAAGHPEALPLILGEVEALLGTGLK